MKKGFTLVELLAVIIILAIILAIAVPVISSLFRNSTKGAIESDAKLLLKSINLKILENPGFDPTTINETNVSSLLNIASNNYKSLKVTSVNNNLSIVLVSKNQWDKFVVSGSFTNLQVHDNLVLWYNFMAKTNTDTDKATATDLSGNNNNGTLNNFAYTTASGYNFGLSFDATDDYISIPGVNFANLTTSTVSFWRKSDEVKWWLLFQGNTANFYLMAAQGAGAFYHDNIGVGTRTIYVDGVASNYAKNDGQWHHYLITGVNLSAWTKVLISNYSRFQYYDYLGDLKIYNKSFTASEAISNYNIEKQYYGF